MRTTTPLHIGMLVIGIAALLTVWPVRLSSQQNAPVRIDNDDIGGVVTSANGPEAGAWVDQHDIFGLGKDVPFATGNLSDSLEALVDGRFVTLRVPYPMGFFSKGMDGRIDDPNAGWKGRGLW